LFKVPKAEPLAGTTHIAVEEAGSSGRLGVALADEWEIKPDELKLGPRIGGSWRYTDVAVKKLIDQDLSGRMLDEFRMETSIMKRLRHVNILLFLGAVSIPGHLVTSHPHAMRQSTLLGAWWGVVPNGGRGCLGLP
jgi:hypothetical protein